MRRKISDEEKSNYRYLRSLVNYLNKADCMRYWTTRYYPAELKHKSIEWHRQRQGWYMFCKRQNNISFEDYIENQYKQKNNLSKSEKQYILQNDRETRYFNSLTEVIYFLGSCGSTVRKMLNEGYEYRSYTLDVIEA